MKYAVFNKLDKSGVIIKVVSGNLRFAELQVRTGQSLLQVEGRVNDATQKVEFDGLDETGQPINPRVVDKSSTEIEVDNPTIEPEPFEKQLISITNEQWQTTLQRIKALEKG